MNDYEKQAKAFFDERERRRQASHDVAREKLQAWSKKAIKWFLILLAVSVVLAILQKLAS